MIGLVIAMILLAFIDVGVELLMFDQVRVNEGIIVLLGLLYMWL